MGWRVVITEFLDRVIKEQDGNDSGAIVVGSSGTAPLENTKSTIVLNPAQTITAGDWLGKHIVMRTTNANNDIGSTVVSEYPGGTTLQMITLTDPLPVTPVAGNKFDIYIENPGNAQFNPQYLIQLDKEIEDVIFETVLEDGFGRASVSLNDRAGYLGASVTELLGRYLMVYDPYGRYVYGGIIINIDISGLGGTIEAMSTKGTLSWYTLTDFGLSNVRSDYAIRQVLQTCIYLDTDDYGVDPFDDGTEWNAYQAARHFYWSADITALEALNDILSSGYEGMGDQSGDIIAVQVWEDSVPHFRVFPRYPDLDDVRWMLSDKNFDYKMQTASFEAGLDSLVTVAYTRYTDANGESVRTSGAYSRRHFDKYGEKSLAYSVNSDSETVVYESLLNVKQRKEVILRPGSFEISGYVKSKSGRPGNPVYLIRSGDIVAVEGQLPNSSIPYQNRDQSPLVFVVGSTSYTASTGKLTITAREPSSYIDLYNARIQVPGVD